MAEVRFGKILENAARLAGRQVAAMGVPENWKALAELSIGEGIRKIAAQKFPMMQRVEYRRYRPTWISNAGWTKGQECWHVDAYYRLEATSGTAAPDVSGSGWKRLDMADVSAFIGWEQPWENTVIDRGSTDVNRFAYEADPRYNPDATPLKIVSMTDLGVVLKAPAPTGVYVRFVPVYPNVSFVEWSAQSAYEAGDVVYVGSTKDCYQCTSAVATGGTSPATDTAHWQAIRISDHFEGFLTRLVASDFLTEDQGKYQTRAAADREFEELCVRYHEGNGENRVRTGRFR